MQVTKSDKALKSVRLQDDYHVRQDVVISSNQQQPDQLRQPIQNNKHSEPSKGNSENTTSASPEEPTNAGLQHAIYRTLDSTDSVLAFLIETKIHPQPKPAQTPKEGPTNDEKRAQRGSKMPKDDKTLMEELLMNNEDLKRMIRQLVSELDKCNQEKQHLQELLTNMRNVSDVDEKARLVLAADSRLGSVDLPPLVPLEMPNFDFGLLKLKD